MKNCGLVTIFLLSFFSLSGQSNLEGRFVSRKEIDQITLVCTYRLIFQPDSLNPYELREEPMLLQIGNQTSLFQSENYFLGQEGIRKAGSLNNFWNDPHRPPSPRFLYQILKNYPYGKITTVDYVLPDNFKYQEDMQILKWEIIDESSIIKEYPVQKATANYAGRSWIAWFSPDIPISDGPYKFHGLPGLILKVHDTQHHYVFELISLEEPDAEQFIKFPEKKYIETTKKNFFQAREAFRSDIINRAAEAGFDNYSQQGAADNMRRRNNPIELTAD
jgi:GLPGLI family protein